MCESSIDRCVLPAPQSRDVMTEILRAGAQKMLREMILQEVEDWLAEHEHLRDEQGRRQVVRNGFLPKRTITTGVGQVEVRQPRVRDRRPADQTKPFSSNILPPYLRKTKSRAELIPWLYLKGVSTPANNAAGCIRRRMFWTVCRNVFNRKRSRSCTTSGWPTRGSMPIRRSICSRRRMRRNIRRRSRALPRTARSY